jgi:hypothetical protein
MPPLGGEGRLGPLVMLVRAKSMPDGQITKNLCDPVQPLLEKYFA